MNNVNIVYSSSGLGTPATGQDFISGLIFYSTSTNSITECLSVSDIENAGFTANTIANISAATYSDVIHYHVAEYFRLNPTGRLFVQTVNSASTLSYEEIVTLQEFSGGIIRQTGVYEYIVMSGTCPLVLYWVLYQEQMSLILLRGFLTSKWMRLNLQHQLSLMVFLSTL